MSEQQQVKCKIVICLLVTRKYHVFVQPLIDSICKYFLLRHEIEINIFTDRLEVEYYGDKRVKIVKELIPSYKFPEITLYRFSIMTSKTYQCDYIYYIDIDALIVSEIDETIFGNIVVVRHPGFDKINGGSWETNELSTAYTFPENRISYWAGGFNGGKLEYFYRAMQQMKRNIDEDEKNGVLAIWHDESHLNKLVSELKSFTELDSSYCTPEPLSLRQAWKIDGLFPKILMLDKDHKKIRE